MNANHTSTLPRSSMAPRNYGHSHGTMIKKSGIQASGEELRPLTGNGDHVHHHHNPSTDTLRRVRFEKTGTPESSNTPTSPMSMAAASTQKEEPMMPTMVDVKNDVNDVGKPNGNGVVKNSANSNSTFKSPPHVPHIHNDQEADTRM